MRSNQVSSWEVREITDKLEDNKDTEVVKLVECARQLIRQQDEIARELDDHKSMLKAYRAVMQDCMSVPKRQSE